MLKREGAKLYALVDKWRDEANDIMEDIRACNYADQSSRVSMYVRAQELRRCARNLKRRVDELHRAHS
jgi:hypothetical protein